ncbi:MAG: T9SS type A sorting domain-containing protein [Bacteroidetes bacterium]|nr:T9SS type A sorting domain-containing protein [Bacteroidota bacterium]
MKNYIILLLIISCTFRVNGQLDWTAKKNFGGGNRYSTVSFALNDKGYTGMGLVNSVEKKDLWEYDPVNNTWTQKADLPGAARKEASSFAINGRGYVGLGWSSSSGTNFYPDFYRYNPDSNIWTKVASFPNNRYSATGFSIGSKGYITCGIVSGTPREKDLWEYDPSTNKWTQKASLPTAAPARSYPVCLSDENYGYLATGFNGTGHENDFYKYDPSNNTWTQLAGFPGAKRANASGFRIENRLYIGSGYDGKLYRDWYYYHTDSAKWVKFDSHPSKYAFSMTAFALLGKGYTISGYDISNATDLVYSFDATPWASVKKVNQVEKMSAPFYQEMLSNILVAKSDYKNLILEVMDNSGKRCVHLEIKQIRKGEKVNLPLPAAGIYFLRVMKDSKTSTTKMWIQ